MFDGGTGAETWFDKESFNELDISTPLPLSSPLPANDGLAQNILYTELIFMFLV